MLNIRFGATDSTVTYVDGFFNSDYEDEWLLDPFVQGMVLDIDKSNS